MVWMPFRIAKLAPGSRQFASHVPDGVIHEVIGPLARLPAELPLDGLHLHSKPVDDWVLPRSFLLKGVVRVDLDIYLPDVRITAGYDFICRRVPPILPADVDDVVEPFVELVGCERPAP